MCGIAGILRNNHLETLGFDIKKMTDAIAHRGPDGEGQWTFLEKGVSLGHRRLSILDLSDVAGQPMHYHEKYTITFNGEIYNYLEIKDDLIKLGVTFKTTSDTEVLLAAFDHWGESCLEKLNGMFAFAIYDKVKDELFCARDRFGEKPFFYAYVKGNFSFASEMKSLFSIGIEKSVSQHMLFNYLAYDIVEDPNDKSSTFFRNINQLPASHCLTIDANRSLKIKRYWNIDPKFQIEISQEEADTQFLKLFDDSISKRLRSDVKVGSSLSGGVDSSSILGSILTKNPNQHFNTFTARFDDENFDEGEYVDLLRKQYQFQENFCYPNKNQLITELDTIFHHQEEPFGSSSIVAQWEVMKLARANDTIVLLDGQGADETIAGYFKYYTPLLYELRKNKNAFATELSSIENHLNERPFLSQSEKIRMQAPALYDTLAKSTRKLRKSTIGQDLSSEFYRSNIKSNSPFHRDDNLNEFLYNDTFKYGLGKLLRFSDRNAMAHGVEVRLPYLSHHLVEFVFSLPSQLKIQDGWTKKILRTSMKGRVPQEILFRKDKKGFQAPTSWMEDPAVKELIAESVSHLKSERLITNETPINNWKYIMASKLMSNG